MKYREVPAALFMHLNNPRKSENTAGIQSNAPVYLREHLCVVCTREEEVDERGLLGFLGMRDPLD